MPFIDNMGVRGYTGPHIFVLGRRMSFMKEFMMKRIMLSILIMLGNKIVAMDKGPHHRLECFKENMLENNIVATKQKRLECFKELEKQARRSLVHVQVIRNILLIQGQGGRWVNPELYKIEDSTSKFGREIKCETTSFNKGLSELISYMLLKKKALNNTAGISLCLRSLCVRCLVPYEFERLTKLKIKKLVILGNQNLCELPQCLLEWRHLEFIDARDTKIKKGDNVVCRLKNRGFQYGGPVKVLLGPVPECDESDGKQEQEI